MNIGFLAHIVAYLGNNHLIFYIWSKIGTKFESVEIRRILGKIEAKNQKFVKFVKLGTLVIVEFWRFKVEISKLDRITTIKLSLNFWSS